MHIFNEHKLSNLTSQTEEVRKQQQQRYYRRNVTDLQHDFKYARVLDSCMYMLNRTCVCVFG